MASSVLSNFLESVYSTRYFHPGAVFFIESTSAKNFTLFLPQAFGRIIHNVEPDSGQLLISLNCKADNVIHVIPLMRSRQPGSYYLGAGWKYFLQRLNITEGCVLMFTYLGLLDFEVAIMRTSFTINNGSSLFEPERFGYPYQTIVQPPLADVPLAAPYERVILKHMHRQITIAREFVTGTNLTQRNCVMMRVKRSRVAWKVTVTYSKSNGYRFGGGWKHAYKWMECTVGDICIFSICGEMSTAEALCIEVQKFSKTEWLQRFGLGFNLNVVSTSHC